MRELEGESERGTGLEREGERHRERAGEGERETEREREREGGDSRRECDRMGTTQGSLAWPLRRDDSRRWAVIPTSPWGAGTTRMGHYTLYNPLKRPFVGLTMGMMRPNSPSTLNPKP